MTTEQMIGQFHPIVLHFPIVLFTAALVTDVLYYFGKTKTLIAGHWLVIAGVVMCIPTIITGLAAAAGFNPSDPLVEKHAFLGYATGVCGSLYAGLRISAMRWRLPLRPSHYVFLSILLVALVSWTSDYGGLITRGTTPFSKNTKVAFLEDHHHEDGVHEHKSHEFMEPAALADELKRSISVRDVIPIFVANKCEECHAKNFPDGKPAHFFEGQPEKAFLQRNADGSLKDYSTSTFYHVVVLGNEMPLDAHGKSIGLTPVERLVLLRWLQNGAPMD